MKVNTRSYSKLLVTYAVPMIFDLVPHCCLLKTEMCF